MRGALDQIIRNHAAPGIIPAYAGSTCAGHILPYLSGDHPRVCGEHLLDTGLNGHRGGIIPAYAGSTAALAFGFEPIGDHPRVCGEHEERGIELDGMSGSSPRMRGALPHIGTRETPRGIIPAYAGSTPSSAHPACGPRDHPRVCGEHQGRGPQLRRAAGSSPRMRGALERDDLDLLLDGIIPAYAGSTKSARASLVVMRDHPRVCGEHTKAPRAM